MATCTLCQVSLKGALIHPYARAIFCADCKPTCFICNHNCVYADKLCIDNACQHINPRDYRHGYFHPEHHADGTLSLLIMCDIVGISFPWTAGRDSTEAHKIRRDLYRRVCEAFMVHYNREIMSDEAIKKFNMHRDYVKQCM